MHRLFPLQETADKPHKVFAFVVVAVGNKKGCTVVLNMTNQEYVA
jgi:hypothetical protein